MLSFLQFTNNYGNFINEVHLTFGGKIPRRGNVVIMAGGAGSGKGFVKDNLVGLNAKVFDPDKIKELAIKMKDFYKHQSDFDEVLAGDNSTKHLDPVKVLNDIITNDKALKNPDNVSALHLVIKKLGWDVTKKKMVFDAVKMVAEKPNLIFDTVLGNTKSFSTIVDDCISLGYDAKNIHLVWVLNSFDVAKKQNQQRSRTVSDKVMIDTHTSAANTMYEYIYGLVDEYGIKNSGYTNALDGDVYIVFNNVEEGDSEWKRKYAGYNPYDHPTEKELKYNKKKGKFEFVPKKQGNALEKAMYIRVKEAGEKIDLSKLTPDIVNKINRYIPYKANHFPMG